MSPHGRLFWFAGTQLPSLRAVDQNFGEFVTQSGVFSAGAVDPASALLAEALPEHLAGDVLDLGATDYPEQAVPEQAIIDFLETSRQ